MDEQDSFDQVRLSVNGKEITLIGTAHISQESVDIVTRIIQKEKPDTVCVELDDQRYQALKNPNRWESLNIIKVIRNGQAPFLLTNLMLSAFQKRMGLQTGVKPGAELAAAAQVAEEMEIKVELVDRNIRTTLLRVWRKTGLWKKMQLMATIVASLFESQAIDEEELAKLKSKDTLSVMLEEMAEILPSVKSILVDERDQFMAEKIRNAPGERIVAVVGAAHCPGIINILENNISVSSDELDVIPEKPLISKFIPWLIPGIVIGLFIAGFFWGDRTQVSEAATAWILANGLFSAGATILALGHPVTIVTSFIAAPVTSLNPTIGAGMVAGLVQAFVAGPTVKDLENIGDDLVHISGWWKNKFARVLLVFFFSSFGSAIGTFVAFGWLKDLV